MNYELERLREQLAIHAPLDIPDWFKPVLPPLPQLPKLPKVAVPYHHWENKELNVSSLIQCSMNRYLKKLQDGEIPDALDLDYPTLQKQFGMPAEAIDAIYDPFYRGVKPYLDALRAREADTEQARLGQWPWAYADLVLRFKCQPVQ